MSVMSYASDGVTAARNPQTQLRFETTDLRGKSVYVLMTDLSRTTTELGLAWTGNDRQAHNVRAQFPHTRTMRLVRHVPRNSTRKD